MVSGRAFEPGEVYYAVLFEHETGFERRDYAAECWEGPPEGYLCFWRTRVPQRVERRTLVDDDVLINLFLRLEEATTDFKVQFRFVLALLLMRKRLLRYEETVQLEDHESWIMRLVRDQSRHQVYNPRMQDHEIARVGDELTAVLRGDPLPDSAPEAGSEADTTAGDDGEAPPTAQAGSVPEAQQGDQ